MVEVCLLKVRRKQNCSLFLESLWYSLFLGTTYSFPHCFKCRAFPNSEVCLCTVTSPSSLVKFVWHRLGEVFMTKACKSGLDVNPCGREVLRIEGAGVAQASWRGDLPVCCYTLLDSKARWLRTNHSLGADLEACGLSSHPCKQLGRVLTVPWQAMDAPATWQHRQLGSSAWEFNLLT